MFRIRLTPARPLIGSLLFLSLAAGTSAQQVDDRESRRVAERWEQYDIALGLGFGIDRVNFDERSENVGVSHFLANFRFNFWDDDGGDFGRSNARRSSLKAYLEAEVGYWSDSELRPFESDLLIGINGIAALPAGPAEVFFGAGFGYHFFGGGDPGEALAGEDREIGGNLQFGVDINFTRNLALFGSGRYDILLGNVYDFQTKITGGVRLKF